MSETNNESLDSQTIEEPNSQALNVEAAEVKPVDTPEGNGGSGGGLNTTKTQ